MITTTKKLFLCFFIASISTSYAQSCQNCFVTTWNTEAGEGQTGSTTIVLPLSGGAYDVDVNNDGDFDDNGIDLTNQTGTITIDFTVFEGAAGMHTIAVRPNATNNTEGRLQINHGLANTTPEKLSSIGKWGNIVWTSMAYAFRDCSNMILATDAGVPDLTEVTNMTQMFIGATNLTGDLSGWNVSNATDMSWMFNSATNFTSDLSNWDVSKVTSMQSTFSSATSFTSDLSTWNVSNVINMPWMFNSATNFTSDLSSWNVSKVTSMQSTFSSATSFTSDLSSWNVSKVTSMQSTFSSATSFNGDLSSWDVFSVTSMANMLNGATNFNNDLSNWNVSKVGDMNYMFNGATSFNSDLSNWNVSKVGDMNYMFNGATSFNSDLSNWSVSKVGNMNYMFSGATNFNSNLNRWNVSNVTSMAGMFDSATSFTGDLSNWNVSKVTNMNYMFYEVASFNSDLSNWDVSSVTTMESMLDSATSFNSDLSSWNVSKVTNMDYMLFGATSFTSENYDALLTGWSRLPTLQDGVPFGAPPTTYCAGEAGRDILIGTYNWDISEDTYRCLAAPFVTTWNTEEGTDQTGNTTIELPLSGGAYDIDTNNDGTFDLINHQSQTVELGSTGVHTIAVRPNADNINNQLRINHYDIASNSVIGTPQKLMSINKWGGIVWTSMRNAFQGCSNMTIANDAGVPDLTEVTSMSEMLFNATGFNGDLSNWNVSKVASMEGMFSGATSFNGDLSNWNVSNVIYMRNTFFNATSFNSDLSNWNVSKVRDMAYMFNGATSFNNNLNSWDVSNVSNMESTFSNTTNFTGNLSNWNVSSVTSMNNMFSGAASFTDDLSNWNVSNVAGMRSTFQEATSFNSNLSNWDVSNVTDMSGTFYNAANFNSDLSSWDVSQVTYMWGTFSGAANFNSNLNTWDVSLVTDMTGMFSGVTGFSSENYDALLTGWSNLTPQRDVPFGAPPTTYCTDGEAGRNILINTYNWDIQGDMGLSCPVAPVEPFVTTWNTQAGDSGSTTIMLPLSGGAYDVDRNNDGDFDDDNETNQTGTIEINFPTAGEGKTIAVRPNAANNAAGELRIDHSAANSTPQKLTSIDKWGTIVWTSMENAFRGCTRLTVAADAGVPDLTSVTSMNSMFRGVIFPIGSNSNPDDNTENSWNVSSVTDMSFMFHGASFLSVDLSNWNVSNVTNMNNMFHGAGFFSVDLSNWNVSNVTNMNNMFFGAGSFNSDISDWNTSKVTDMNNMFSSASTFASVISTWNVSNVTNMNNMFFGAGSFNSDISDWNTSKVTDMNSMFSSASTFASVISTWDTSKVTDMNNMFFGATNFNSDINWDTSQVTNMRRMFQNATSFNNDISAWNTSQVTDMRHMLNNATSFTSDLSSWDVSSVTLMDHMFNNASSFNSNLGTWNVSQVISMINMLTGATSFTPENYDALLLGWSNLPTLQKGISFGAPPTTYCTDGEEGRDILIGTGLEGGHGWMITGDSGFKCQFFTTTWNTEAGEEGSTEITLPIVEGAYDVDIDDDGTFEHTNLQGSQTIDLGNPAGERTISVRPNANNQLRINFSTATGKEQKLTSIDKWGPIVWTSMENAFKGCSNMTIAEDAGVPDLTMVTNMNSMFSGATNFNSDISAWNTSQVTDMGHMLEDTSSFTSDLSSWDVSSVTLMDHMFNNATSFNSNLGTWNVSQVSDMSNMLTGATSFTPKNYEALLSGWSGLPSLQSGVPFGAPPTTYCTDGEAGKNTLTNADTHNWTINGDNGLNCPFVTTWNTEAGEEGSTEITLPIVVGAYDVDINNDGIFEPEHTNLEGSQTIDLGLPAGVRTISVRPNAANTNNQLRIVFSTATSKAQKLTSIDKWGPIVWTSMENAFSGCSNMTIAEGAGVPDLTMVTNTGAMFSSCTNFNSDISTWDVSQVTSMASMFLGAESFRSDLGSWDVSQVTDFTSMLRRAILFTSDLSSWNVSKATKMTSMFNGASFFNSDLSSWDVSQVTNMISTFSEASRFNSDLSSWDVSQVTNMQSMLHDCDNFRDKDYEALLAGWSSLPTLQRDVVFGPPPKKYCGGKAGRDILTGTYNWSIREAGPDTGGTGDIFECSELSISAKAFLQGPYNTTTSIMNASLLTANNDANIIPTETPYGDGAMVESTVFNTTTGDDAIVDWVEVSLHHPNDVSIVISSTSALLQKDGDVVALDGSSALQIQGIAGDYKVSINHRNHIPVITDAAQSLSTTETAIDFANDLTIVTGGSNAMSEVATGVYALFSGDVNQNGQVQVDDYNAAIQDVGRGGYLTSDVDMNGELQVSDINFVLKTLGKGVQF